MTRINVVSVTELADQHLMAEYRELPMVFAAARRSNPAKFKSTNVYTLNKGHVTFFFDKRAYLMNRWVELVEELRNRGFSINPQDRIVQWKELDKFPQIHWQPDDHARCVNLIRLQEKIAQKPSWYRFRGKPFVTC